MRRITLLTLFAAAGLMAAGQASAQDLHLRAEGTAFIKPKVGISHYRGDNEKSLTYFDGYAFDTAFPWGLGIEGGYQFTVQNSVSLGLYIGDYPVITQFPPPPALGQATTLRPIRRFARRSKPYIAARSETRRALSHRTSTSD